MVYAKSVSLRTVMKNELVQLTVSAIFSKRFKTIYTIVIIDRRNLLEFRTKLQSTISLYILRAKFTTKANTKLLRHKW